MKQPITKASGQQEAFNSEKALSSYKRAGATEQLANRTLRAVRRDIGKSADTNDIYSSGLHFLNEHAPAIASRYSLKRAIMNLGPAGYIFEKFVARLLESEGYTTQVSQVLRGHCVAQEIDIIATKGDQKIMVECKYHNRPGLKSDLKVALYTQARFQDVQERGGFTEAWLVTNTHSTTEAGKYARCMGMKLIAWRYPYKGGLEKWIEDQRLYPITILPALPANVLSAFADAGIILVKDLAHFSVNDLVTLFHLKPKIAKHILASAQTLNSAIARS
ncbi:MAG: ATPase [Deltaproteobacteria bacterium CG11_big_fil_rev_8_21_14_0_20_47_16]|nr:MAG: ATPase [Deltaproteobacteria bacterium CG11_big_fil_rev_8_21_14_0_20_47_16]